MLGSGAHDFDVRRPHGRRNQTETELHGTDFLARHVAQSNALAVHPAGARDIDAPASRRALETPMPRRPAALSRSSAATASVRSKSPSQSAHGQANRKKADAAG